MRAHAKALRADDSGCEEAQLRLHLDWNRVLGLYLAHLDDEERTLLAKIEHQLPGASHVGKSVAHFPPSEADAYVKTLLTIVTPRERAAIEPVLSAR